MFFFYCSCYHYQCFYYNRRCMDTRLIYCWLSSLSLFQQQIIKVALDSTKMNMSLSFSNRNVWKTKRISHKKEISRKMRTGNSHQAQEHHFFILFFDLLTLGISIFARIHIFRLPYNTWGSYVNRLTRYIIFSCILYL